MLTRVCFPLHCHQRGKSSSCACTLHLAWSLTFPELESEQETRLTSVQETHRINHDTRPIRPKRPPSAAERHAPTLGSRRRGRTCRSVRLTEPCGAVIDHLGQISCSVLSCFFGTIRGRNDINVFADTFQTRWIKNSNKNSKWKTCSWLLKRG